jgi:hypothetical protein
MKKTPQKLVLRSQTLRVLVKIDLVRAVGGLDSGNVRCPALADTEDAACPTWPAAPVVATAACR